MTKICTKCLQEKALIEYSKNKCTEDGRAHHCKACCAAYKAANPHYEYTKGYNAGISSVTRKEYNVVTAALRHVLTEQYMEKEDKIVECIESFGDYLHSKSYFGADFNPKDAKLKAKAA